MRILDIGANNGEYAFKLTNNGINQVVAVEANPKFSNVSHGKENIIWENVAVSSMKKKSIKIHLSKWDCLSSINKKWLLQGRFAGMHAGESIRVSATTIDALVRKYEKFDHIKVDVEGYEDEVMMGMSKNYCPIQFEWAVEWFEDVTLKAIKRLEEIGYSKWNVAVSHDFLPWELPDDYLSIEELTKIIIKTKNLSVHESWGMILAR